MLSELNRLLRTQVAIRILDQNPQHDRKYERTQEFLVVQQFAYAFLLISRGNTKEPLLILVGLELYFLGDEDRILHYMC